MQFYKRTIRNAALASLGVLAACDRSDVPTAPAPVFNKAGELAVEVSSLSATFGQRVAVAIANVSASPIGGVQGKLRFNPSQMAYRGQVRDGSSNAMMIVNADDAASGTLTVAILDPANLKHSDELVFDVLGQGYASSISFVPQEVATNGSPIRLIKADVASALIVNHTLEASADAKRMSIADWSEALDALQPAREPGMIVNGLKFGDTNGNGTITLSDALYVVNVSVGANELIIGTDGTGITGVVDGVVAGNVIPANIDGTPSDLGEAADPTPPGLEADGRRLLSLADALAIVNESVGSLQPVVGEIIPGRPTTPVSGRTVVSANITTNTTWAASTIYELSGRITVTNGATLTIQAGTRVEGQRGVVGGAGGYLAIARDGKIDAQGTPLQPIIFTCTLNAGETARAKGCWGGISVLGNAHLNETGTLTSPIIAGRAATGGCREGAAEGSAGLYGGCNDDDNSGIMRYIRVEYAGFRFNAENELNGLALYGVGRGTAIDHVQIHGGLDDALEMFGGTVNMKYIYATATSDDGFDYTFGWDGKAQYVLVQFDALDSDNCFENDNATTNFDALPRATPTVYNVSCIGMRNNRVGVTESQNRGLLIRRGTRPHYFNFHVEGLTQAINVRDASTCVNFGTATGFELKNSTFTLNQNDGEATAPPAACGASATAIIDAAGSGNTRLAASPLLSPLSLLVPDFRPSSTAAVTGATPPNDGFFDIAATYVGAVAPSTATKNNAPWYSGWTRGWQNATTP